MLSEFLTPLTISTEYEDYQIGKAIDKYTNHFPDISRKKIAIVGVKEGRNSIKNKETRLAPDSVRSEFYQLSIQPSMINYLVDLGNIEPGETIEDTEVALERVAQHLREVGIVTVVLGGGSNLCYALYKSMNGASANLDLTYVSAHLPILENQVLSKVCSHQPNFLFNINALGFQSHYVPSSSLDIMNKLGFNQMRLGQLRSSIEEAEPLIRNTNMFLLDVGVVKQADAPANFNSNPNGIDGDVACKLCWYAGISDLTSIMGLFEMNPEFDFRNQTAKLCSQMLWYFIDGFSNRVNDHPEQHQEFVRYRCNIESNNPDIVFYKSKRTSRWWMEIPHPKSLNNPNRNVMVPCSYGDYQTAATGELPDRYLSTVQKMH